MAGLLAGAGAAWLLAADPGAGMGRPGTLRADVDELRRRVGDLDARFVAAEATWRAAVERTAGPASSEPTVAPEQLAALADDLRALRDFLRSELKTVESRLADLQRRIDDAQAPNAPRTGPLSPEEEEHWAATSRDSDAGVRSSALTMLGRARSERAVQVALERLDDEDVEVVYHAIRNLGRFGERDAAPQVARFLDHADVVLRAAAHRALEAMGAPKDAGYDPTASAERRRVPAETLRRWSEAR